MNNYTKDIQNFLIYLEKIFLNSHFLWHGTYIYNIKEIQGRCLYDNNIKQRLI